LRSVLTKGDIDKLKAVNNIISIANQPEPLSDDLLSAIAKFIPGEAVFIFLGTLGILERALETTPVEWIGIFMFFFCLAVAIVISYFKASTEKIQFPGRSEKFEIPKKEIKVAITAVAFIIWALNIEGFVAIVRGFAPVYDPIIGSLILLAYSTLIPLAYVYLSKP